MHRSPVFTETAASARLPPHPRVTVSHALKRRLNLWGQRREVAWSSSAAGGLFFFFLSKALFLGGFCFHSLAVPGELARNIKQASADV